MTHEEELKKEKQLGYSNGYQAGKRLADAAREEGYQRGLVDASGDVPATVRRYDLLMAKALNSVLEHCHGWSIGGKKISNSEGYVTLAKAFVDNMILTGPKS